ncbi:extended synaptotagmin-2 [Ixodes scapularis]
MDANRPSTTETPADAEPLLPAEKLPAEKPASTEPVKQARAILRTTLGSLVYKFAKGMLIAGSLYIMGWLNLSPAWLLMGVASYVAQKNYIEQKRIRTGITSTEHEKASVLATLEDLPAWVFFPDTERAEWVNKILGQFWPFVGNYVKDLILESIEPSVRSSLPAYLHSFKFEKIDLGDVPPRIGGVKVYKENVSRNEVIMDLELFYSGDCKFSIKVKGFKAGIRDLQVHGHLRVVMRPLTKEMPIVGGVTVFFLRPPAIDFQLTNLGQVLEVPGLNDLLKKAVSDQVAAMMVLPNKFSMKLQEHVSTQSLRFSLPCGVLRLEVVAAKDLVKADIGMLGLGKSDPYAIITVGAQEFRTQVIPSTVNPKWNFYCEAVIYQIPGSTVDIDVMDEDQSSKDDFLGRVSVSVSDLQDQGQGDMWLTLDDTKSGKIRLRTFWLSLTTDTDDLPLQLERVKSISTKTPLSTAVLIVFLDSAKHLPNASRAAGEPSPQVQLVLGHVERWSSIKHSTNDPVWEEIFYLLLANPEVQEMEIKVLPIPRSDLLKKAVSDQVAAMMVLPNKFSMKLQEHVSTQSLRFSLPCGVLRLEVVAAKDLVKADIGMLGLGKSDPYAIITVGAQEFRTQVIPSTVNPKWNFYCEWSPTLSSCSYGAPGTGAVVLTLSCTVDFLLGSDLPDSWVTVDIDVMDEDQSSKDDFLGRVSVSVSDLQDQGQGDMWLTLDDTKSGKIRLRTFWLSLTTDTDDLPLQLERVKSISTKTPLSTAVLIVFLDSAKHLPNASRAAGEPSPQVQLVLGHVERWSSIKHSTNDPVWEEIFYLLLANPEVQEMEIKVVDNKTGQVLGHLPLRLSRLLKEEGLKIDEPLILLGTGHQAKLKLTLQLRLLHSAERRSSTSGTPVQRHRASVRSVDETGPTASPSHQQPSPPPPPPRGSPPPSPRVAAAPSLDEVVQSTVSPILDSMAMGERALDASHRDPQSREICLPRRPQVVDNKTGQVLGHLPLRLSRLLKEEGLKIDEPLILLGTGHQAKLKLTLQLRLLHSAERRSSTSGTPVQRHRASVRSVDETGPTASPSHQQPSPPPPPPRGSPPPSPRVAAAPSLDEVVQSTVSPILDSMAMGERALDASHRDPQREVLGDPGAGKLQLTLRYSAQRSRLVVVIHRAVNLAHKEGDDLPDPYVKLHLLPDKLKENKRKTQTCRNSCNPVFDETMEIEGSLSELEGSTLQVSVNSKSGSSMFSRGKVLGSTQVSLANLDLTKAHTDWYDLEVDA